MRAGGGVGIARCVTFSLALIGALSTGAGGGKLERATGMSLEIGASPPRTTTAWRGGGLSPGRAMNPPRGVIASLEIAAPDSGGSWSWASLVLIGLGASFLPCLRAAGKKVILLPTLPRIPLGGEHQRQQRGERRHGLYEQNPDAHGGCPERPCDRDAAQKECRNRAM